MVPGTCHSRSPVAAERPESPSAPAGRLPTVKMTSGADPSSTASQPAVSSIGTREPSASRSVPLYADDVHVLSMKTPARAGSSQEAGVERDVEHRLAVRGEDPGVGVDPEHDVVVHVCSDAVPVRTPLGPSSRPTTSVSGVVHVQRVRR